MKKFFVVFAAVLLSGSVFGQKTADLGIWAGTSTYFGDLDNALPIQGYNPNFGGYFRYNFNSRIGLRFMFLSGKMKSEGTILEMPATFSKNMQDVSLQIEINYLRFITGLKNTRFSPYIMSGVGVSYFPYNLNPGLIFGFNPIHNKGIDVLKQPTVTPNIPFGFGIKYNVGKRLSVGAEYQVRKLFSDKLDDLDDPLAFTKDGREITYTTLYHNNDWPGYLGMHLTFLIYIGRKACPAYDSKIK
jgi:opacity protein-like surface antigen